MWKLLPGVRRHAAQARREAQYQERVSPRRAAMWKFLPGVRRHDAQVELEALSLEPARPRRVAHRAIGLHDVRAVAEATGARALREVGHRGDRLERRERSEAELAHAVGVH